MSKVYLDTETCGLAGTCVLIQYAHDDGDITLYEPWREPVHKTLALIEEFLNHTIVGFNLAFDGFHLIKLYTMLRLLPKDWIPIEHINEVAAVERKAMAGPFLKPAGILDLMLHARKGPFQSLMARDDIRIRKVPTLLANPLAEELERRVEIDSIYFARSKDGPRWRVYDRKREGLIDPDFKDVVLKFNPAGGLKFLAKHAMGFEVEHSFSDVELDKKHRPIEYSYAPFAISRNKDWSVVKDGEVIGHAWPGVIQLHCDHWRTNVAARSYAHDDIVYTRALDKYFDYPEPNDDDSVLAWAVAASRWRGYKLDLPGIKRARDKAIATVKASPIAINKPTEVRRYLSEVMDDTELLTIAETTRRAKLEKISKEWTVSEDEPCSKCQGSGCARCSNGVLKTGPHPAALRAKELLDIRIAAKEAQLYTKLLRAKRLHPDLNVIGTLSFRMSGTGGLNPQAINRTNDVRSLFLLADKGMCLNLGDLVSCEVTILQTDTGDEQLKQDLLSGEKIHAFFGAELYGVTYDEVIASKGKVPDFYNDAKRGFFSTVYGGTDYTMVKNLGVTAEQAQRGFAMIDRRYPAVKAARDRMKNEFCALVQPKGIGTAVVWRTPPDFVESLLGFRRYYLLENKICKALFDLARRIPAEWRNLKVKVIRSARVQTCHGAVASSLYAAAFGIQGAMLRSGGNHKIQNVGALVTKRIQRRVWDLQPVGVHPPVAQTMNIHDEVIAVSPPESVPAVTLAVASAVEEFREKVPLLTMSWGERLDSWADKSAASIQLGPLGD